MVKRATACRSDLWLRNGTITEIILRTERYIPRNSLRMRRGEVEAWQSLRLVISPEGKSIGSILQNIIYLHRIDATHWNGTVLEMPEGPCVCTEDYDLYWFILYGKDEWVIITIGQKVLNQMSFDRSRYWVFAWYWYERTDAKGKWRHEVVFDWTTTWRQTVENKLRCVALRGLASPAVITLLCFICTGKPLSGLNNEIMERWYVIREGRWAYW